MFDISSGKCSVINSLYSVILYFDSNSSFVSQCKKRLDNCLYGKYIYNINPNTDNKTIIITSTI